MLHKHSGRPWCERYENSPSVAWLIQGDEKYGVMRTSLSLTQALNVRGWHTPVISLGEGKLMAEFRNRGLEVVALGVERPPSFDGKILRKGVSLVQSLRCQRRVYPKVASALTKLGADIVHVRWANLIGIAGAAARAINVPCVWQMPTVINTRVPFQLNKSIYQWQCLSLGITPLANSKFTAQTLGSHPVSPRVLYLGADKSRFDPQHIHPVTRAELGTPETSIVFGIFARLCESKGQGQALRGMLQLGEHQPPLHLLLLGGPMWAFL